MEVGNVDRRVRGHRRRSGAVAPAPRRARERLSDQDRRGTARGSRSARAARLERDLRNLGHLRTFALPVIDRLAAWPASATWGEWLDRFTALVPDVVRRPERVLRVLAELRPMSAIGPVSLDEARDIMADRLLTLEVEPTGQRYGRVFVGNPQQARGRAFRVVFVAGLAERLFPQRPHEDPMLLDEEMREPLDATLPVQKDRVRTERLLLRLAVGAATDRLWLSYPRLEIAESRPRVPSFYALESCGRSPARSLARRRCRSLPPRPAVRTWRGRRRRIQQRQSTIRSTISRCCPCC